MNDPFAPRRQVRTANGVWFGTVTRLDGTAPYVEIPRLHPGHAFGPLTVVELPTALVVGDRVLVSFVEGNPDRPIVTGRLP